MMVNVYDVIVTSSILLFRQFSVIKNCEFCDMSSIPYWQWKATKITENIDLIDIKVVLIFYSIYLSRL